MKTKKSSKRDNSFLRLMLCVLFIPCLMLMQGSIIMPLYYLSGICLLYSLLLFLSPAVDDLLNSIPPLSLLIDLLLISSALFFLEPWYVLPTATFYIFPIIAYSFQSKPVIPYLIAFISGTLYITIGFYRDIYLVPIVVQVLLFFITAFFTTFLAQHFHSTYFQQANLDTLTKIHNRRFFNFILNKLLDNKTPFSLILIDIDNFKLLNDTQGHHHGDYVLKIIASVLKEHTRSTDIVARFGGDEFAIILPNSSKQESLTIADRIRKGVLINPKLLTYPHISVSLGLAAHPSDGDEMEELLQKADAALYKAKDLGKNTVYFYEKE